jgi:LacI family transcriptional regulator, xylobiose transport system transcriptional regulator
MIVTRTAPAWRGSIDVLPRVAYRVRVEVGVDPLTGKQLMRTERVPPGRSAGKEAEKVRTRLLRQVEERRSSAYRHPTSQMIKAPRQSVSL